MINMNNYVSQNNLEFGDVPGIMHENPEDLEK
jgi:hypothetical protein